MKTILITGASTGLGRAATLLFQSEVGRLRRAGSGDFGEQAVYTKTEKISPWVLGLLSEKEYRNPLLVFKKAFREYTLKEFDYFMSGIVYFSMGVYENLPERNIVMPYIHTIKMLDAAHLILQRRREKNMADTHSE